MSASAQTPRLSADGTRLAYAVGSHAGNSGIFMLDLERGATNRLADGGQVAGWHPDGETIAFFVGKTKTNIHTIRADGAGAPIPAPIGRWGSPLAYSPDGQRLVFRSCSSETGSDLWTTGFDGDPVPFLETGFDEGAAMFSPDERHIVLVSDESGREEVYVRDFREGERVWSVSTDGGREPRWSESGEIFYRDGARMMVVEVATEPGPRLGRPVVLSRARFAPVMSRRSAPTTTSPRTECASW